MRPRKYNSAGHFHCSPRKIYDILLMHPAMSTSSSTDPNNAFVPLGAGDLIDRAVRLYRRDFSTLILIAAPPVIVGTVFSVLWAAIARGLLVAGDQMRPEENVAYILFIWLGSTVIWFIETAATLTVMGAASRDSGRHLLFDEEISFREPYRNTSNRLGGLIAAACIVTAIFGFLSLLMFYAGIFIAAILVSITAFVFVSMPAIAAIISIVIAAASALGGAEACWFIESRVPYEP